MFLELIKEGKVNEAYALLTRKPGVLKNTAEYNGDRTIRPSQVGNRPDKRNAEGKDIPVNKIAIPIQKKIVDDASSFIFGKPVKVSQVTDSDNTEKDKDWFEEVMALWKDVRLDSTLSEFCRTVKSETESAIIFYPKGEGADLKIRTRLVTSKNGICKPYFNDFGDMEAFVWEFKAKDSKGKEINKMYVWTADFEWIFEQSNSDWAQVSYKANPFGKIPVVYLSQEFPEWWDVKDLIDRFENTISKFCDVNDYFASPKYKTSGELKKSLADSDVIEMKTVYDEESGKMITADINVLAWDRAPEAIKLELETIKNLILELSSTPDLYSERSGLGNIANYAMELMFLSPILKAGMSYPDYEKAISRCFSLLKSGVAIKNKSSEKQILAIKEEVSFSSVLPKNYKDMIDTLSEATGGKPSMSQESAVALNPLVKNSGSEMELINDEASVDRVGALGETVI